MNEGTRGRSSRVQLMLILAVSLGTVGAAYLLFYMVRDVGPWHTTNRGAFVDPPISAQSLGLTNESGKPFETGGHWWLWVVPKGPCTDECRQAVHQLRQLHVLLQKDAARVRRALVTADGKTDPELHRHYPKLEALGGDVGRLTSGIYVVDPIGNLVFHYRMEQAGEPVLDDMKRLLQVSQIG